MSNLICVDAGPVIQLVAFPDKKQVHADWERWQKQALRMIAPALLFYEVTNVLNRYRKYNLLSQETISDALNIALGLPITLIEDADLHHQAILAAERFNLNAAYDAHYVALAERSGAELWTNDEKLVHRMQAYGVDWVHLIGKDT